VDSAVAVEAEAHEVVVLGDDLAGGPGEVDLEDRHVAAEIGDMEDEVVGQILGVAPDDPAHPRGASPNLWPEVLMDLTRGTRKSTRCAGRRRGRGRHHSRRRHGSPRRCPCPLPAGRAPATARAPARRRPCRSPRRSARPGWCSRRRARACPRPSCSSAPRTSAPRASRCPSTWRTCARPLHGPADHVGPVGRLAFGLSLLAPAPLRRHAAEHAGLR